MSGLESLVQKLKEKDAVDALFITGSHGLGKQKSYSDLDLVIILKENIHSLKSVYVWIDGVFADIFFFDRADLERTNTIEEIHANDMNGIFVSWLAKASIQFDKTGTVSALKENRSLQDKCRVSENEQQEVWQKINYNLTANTRYFESNDPLYHEALEMRLLYSVMELITGYLALRRIPWRGEKSAVQYLKEHDPTFYDLFRRYTHSSDLKTKFELYHRMARQTVPKGYSVWSADDTIVVGKSSDVEQRTLLAYWEELRD